MSRYKRQKKSKSKKKEKPIFLSDIVDDLWDCNFVEILEEPKYRKSDPLLDETVFEEVGPDASLDIFSTLKLARRDSVATEVSSLEGKQKSVDADVKNYENLHHSIGESDTQGEVDIKPNIDNQIIATIYTEHAYVEVKMENDVQDTEWAEGSEHNSNKEVSEELDTNSIESDFQIPVSNKNNDNDTQKNIMFKCDKCAYQTIYKKYLNRHIEYVHFTMQKNHKNDEITDETVNNTEQNKNVTQDIEYFTTNKNYEITEETIDNTEQNKNVMQDIEYFTTNKNCEITEVTTDNTEQNRTIQVKIKLAENNTILSEKKPQYIVFNENQKHPFINEYQVFDKDKFEEINKMKKNKKEKKVVIEVLKHPKSSVFYDIIKPTGIQEELEIFDEENDDFVNLEDVIEEPDLTNKEQVNAEEFMLTEKTTGNNGSSSLLIHSCKKCNFQTKYRYNFFRHINRVHCAKRTSEAEEFMLSEKTTSDNESSGLHRCEKCNFQTRYRNNLVRHMACVHSANRTSEAEQYKVLNCDKCHFETYNLGNLNRHEKCVHGFESVTHVSESFKCDRCNFETNNRSSLSRHFNQVHLGVHIAIDATDDIIMTLKPSSEINVQKKVDESKKIYYCDKCEFKTNFSNCLTKHFKRWHNIDLLKCSICPFEAKDWFRLKAHLNQHSKTNNAPAILYKCGGKCDYQTIEKCALTRHIKKVHGGTNINKLFTCPDCDFKSVYLSSLRKHLKTHQVKPDDYIRREEKIKPKYLECATCHYRTDSRIYFLKHFKRRGVHRLRRTCAICDFPTKNKTILRRHILLEHTS